MGGLLSVAGPDGPKGATALQSQDRDLPELPELKYRRDESTYSIAGSPLLFRIGALGGIKWANHLNVWPDDTSPAGFGAQLILYANLDIGKWFNIGLDYAFDQYHGNGRPSNTSPMPANGAWYLVEQEKSHKLSIAPAINVYRYESKDRNSSVIFNRYDKNDIYGFDTELVEHGPNITGAIKIGALLGVDFINFNSDDYHGYPATEATVPLAGAFINTTWDFWVSKHVGISAKLESRYTHSFDEDGHVSKPCITFLAFGLGLSLR